MPCCSNLRGVKVYDIEVINGKSYAVIEEGGKAYEFLKAMNSRLVMKKLVIEAGDDLFLSIHEIAPLCKGFARQDLKRLQDVGLIEIWPTPLYRDTLNYTFTEYGLEVMKHLKEFGGDIEILL